MKTTCNIRNVTTNEKKWAKTNKRSQVSLTHNSVSRQIKIFDKFFSSSSEQQGKANSQK